MSVTTIATFQGMPVQYPIEMQDELIKFCPVFCMIPTYEEVVRAIKSENEHVFQTFEKETNFFNRSAE